MAYTGYFGGGFYSALFNAAFEDKTTSWSQYNTLYLGTGTSINFSDDGTPGWPSAGRMTNSSTSYQFKSDANWNVVVGTSGSTGYNSNAITITNNEGASRNVTNIGIYASVFGGPYGGGYINISPAITLADGDSIVIPVSGIQLIFSA